MTIETAISAIDPIRTISGLIFTPWVSSLKNVSKPALDAGIGALSFLLMRFVDGVRPFLRIMRAGTRWLSSLIRGGAFSKVEKRLPVLLGH